MEKYIEVKSLIDALEQRKKQLSLWVDKDSAGQRIDEIDCILDVDIVSLQQEQPGVDLEKEDNAIRKDIISFIKKTLIERGIKNGKEIGNKWISYLERFGENSK